MPLKDFCTQYKLSKDIFDRLRKLGFTTAGELFEIEDGELEEHGFKLGHILELKRVLKQFGAKSDDSPLPTTDIPISTFVIYVPDEATQEDRSAVKPEDIQFIQNNFAVGGIVVSVHNSTKAEAWVEEHYDDPVFESARSTGLRGPLAAMLSPDVPALAIFGSILDERVLNTAQALAAVSGFSVMVRPLEDDPVSSFFASDGPDKMLPARSVSPGGEVVDGEGYVDEPVQEHDETDTLSGEDRPWRLRGGRGDDSDHEEGTELEEDNSLPWFGKVHDAVVWLKVHPGEKEGYDVSIRTGTRFCLQSRYQEERKMETQPEVIARVTLKVETPSRISPDRSYTSLGFLAHRLDSIIDRDFVDCGFEQPDQKLRTSEQRTKGTTVAFSAGYPTAVNIGLTSSKGNTQTAELEDNKASPRCGVFFDPGERWNEDNKSYMSYDITTVPGKNPRTGVQHPLKVDFAMGINLKSVKDAGLPTISFITRNQVVLWIQDPTLKAQVRGILVLTTNYIPNIRTREALLVQEDLKVQPFAQNNTPKNPVPASEPAGGPMALSLAIAPITTQPSQKTRIVKLFTDVREKFGAKKVPTLADLPLQEYVARGWDASNGRWRSAIWTSLDNDFRNTELDKAATAPVWKLIWKKAQEVTIDNGASMEADGPSMDAEDVADLGLDTAMDVDAVPVTV
ncbi:hypothetical protein B0H16DRAFT_1703140 [Mycena metata]|uniref:SAM domain-containing protein n=1 Tax=Mycena metata TaxID=1033252 RepID=A0AAD7H526_9AGAR|nr:hypothetical protein B0H16DRAFT_1703140 [Mycena metata]